MKTFLLLLLAALAVLYFPASIAALIGAVAAQPATWAFTCGLLAATRHRTPAARAVLGKESRA